MPVWPDSGPIHNPSYNLVEMAEKVHKAAFASFQAAASAPGTWALLGEHTDHAGGIVLAYQTKFRTAVVLSPRLDDAISLTCYRVGDFQQLQTQQSAAPEPVKVGSFRAELDTSMHADTPLTSEDPAARIANLIATMVHRQMLSRETHGFDITALSDIPPGAGLGEEAALEAAVVLALTAHLDDADTPPQLARFAEACASASATTTPAEKFQPSQLRFRYTTALRGIGNSLNVIDYADHSISPAPGPVEFLQLVPVVVIPPSYAAQHGELARRQAFITEAAKAFAAESLRLLPDATPRVMDWLSAVHSVHGTEGSPTLDEARDWLTFVETETQRATKAVRAIRSRRPEELPAILDASQAALASEYGVCGADAPLAELLKARGAFTARSLEAGATGAVVALVRDSQLKNFIADLNEDGLNLIVLDSGLPAAVALSEQAG
ncbi:galactokinase [Corynebacterium sp. 35RC1]|nr:galactokinase [Corynebacterium sp. 35RC1]